MLADVKLVVLHAGPVSRLRGLDLIAEPGNPPNGVEGELVSIKIVQDHHIEGSRGGALFLITAHMDVVVIASPTAHPRNKRGRMKAPRGGPSCHQP